MRNNTHNYIAKTAIDYANIQPEEIMDICLREEGALVEVDFNTEWMNYICYVDLSGEVLGFLSEPVPIDAQAADYRVVHGGQRGYLALPCVILVVMFAVGSVGCVLHRRTAASASPHRLSAGKGSAVLRPQ